MIKSYRGGSRENFAHNIECAEEGCSAPHAAQIPLFQSEISNYLAIHAT